MEKFYFFLSVSFSTLTSSLEGLKFPWRLLGDYLIPLPSAPLKKPMEETSQLLLGILRISSNLRIDFLNEGSVESHL